MFQLSIGAGKRLAMIAILRPRGARFLFLCWLALVVAGISGCGSGGDKAKDSTGAEQTTSVQNASPNSGSAPAAAIDDSKPPAQLMGIQLVISQFPDGKSYMERQVKKYSDDSMINHGRYTVYYRNGQKFTEGEYADGVKQGPWKMWNDNGQLAKEENFVGGKLDGQWTLFRPDGTKEHDVSYKHGGRDGRWVYYDAKGKPTKQEEYQDDALNGVAIIWYPDGQKQAEFNYKHGLLDGTQSKWFPNGQQSTRAEYSAGNRNGKSLTWNDKGEVLTDEEFENNKRIKK